ncbi:Aspartic proteinase CDR1 [Linum grandiflorum]
MAPRTPLVLLFFFFFSFKYSESLGLTTSLIHHDSIFSPFYNASETTADRSWRATRSSIARHAYLSSTVISPQSIEARLAESMYQSVFYVKFSVGNPPVPQLAVMDTGSHFLWLKCLPCSPCRPMKGIAYLDPAMSSTFSPQPCTKDCKMCSGRFPWSPKHCMYTLTYYGGMQSEGIYATDQLTFRTDTDHTTTIPNIRFGCNSLLSGKQRADQAFNGVLGLGVGDPNDLLSQDSFLDEFDFQFSYCIGSLSDPAYPYSQLAFGDAAILKGKTTEFHTDKSHYNVQIHNISFGLKVFRKMALRKGVVIDSGTTLTHLYTEAYEVVNAAIVNRALGVMVSVPPEEPFRHCYRGRVEKDISAGFPTLELHFAGGASLVLDKRGMFWQLDDDKYCLAIVPSETITIIGILAQQRHNIGFDLKAKNMYVQFIQDCSGFDGLKLTTELIHHDSIFSPFYNASETTSDRAWRATRSSLARHASFASSRMSLDSIEARLEESMYQSVFYVKFSIGSPPVPQLAIMDTGSHFLWLKCLPCNPCQPMKGITKVPVVAQVLHVHGRLHRRAAFEGIYATDQLTFRTATDQTTVVKNVVFGCSSSLGGTQRVDQAFNGVLGLGAGNPSALLHQQTFLDEFDYKFSYCIGSLTDPSYPSNRLAFGQAAIFKGKPTPFDLDHFDYRVQLHNITLGIKTLDIDIGVFRKMALRKGVVIDSGSTLIHLYDEAFEVVKAAVAKQATGVLASVPSPGNPYELCYQGRVEKEAAGFPLLGLHFAGDAYFDVDNRGLFRQIGDNIFCMAIVRSESISLIGIMAQQRYNVAFDLLGKNVYLS